MIQKQEKTKKNNFKILNFKRKILSFKIGFFVLCPIHEETQTMFCDKYVETGAVQAHSIVFKNYKQYHWVFVILNLNMNFQYSRFQLPKSF